MLSLYQESFYHPCVCNICKNTENLKICAKCKSFSYCSVFHQRADWFEHKKLCRVISKSDEDLELKIKNEEIGTLTGDQTGERDAYLAMVEDAWTKRLKRSLNTSEKNVMLYRNICLVCYTKNASIGCKKCFSVFYCSQEHQNVHLVKHVLYCDKLKRNFQLFLVNYHTRSRHVILSKKNICLNVFPENLEKLMAYLEKGNYLVVPRTLSIFEHLSITDNIAPIMNILYGLEKSHLLKKHNFIKTNLVIHIVGADFEERCWDWCLLLEFAFHWIRNLKHLTYIAIGPEVGSWTYSLMNMSPICGFCNMNTSNIKLYSYPISYHIIVDELAKPDLVIAFNCGIFQIPTWRNSIPSLTKYPGVPLVLTDYRLEYMEKNLAEIRNHSKNEIEVILEPQRNPFSCISPQRFELKNDPICYKNEYISIITSALK